MRLWFLTCVKIRRKNLVSQFEERKPRIPHLSPKDCGIGNGGMLIQKGFITTKVQELKSNGKIWVVSGAFEAEASPFSLKGGSRPRRYGTVHLSAQ
jgi:hypothetical protein